jgi:hypothetical protein
MSDGKSVETGLIGKEGFIGLPLAVGLETSPTRAVMQLAGTGFSVSARNIGDVLRGCPELEKRLHSYSHVRLLQATQLAACNRLHGIEERFSAVVIDEPRSPRPPSFQLTQESLADILGTLRTSVTRAARTLQAAGAMTYKRPNKYRKPGQVTRCRLRMPPYTQRAIRTLAGTTRGLRVVFFATVGDGDETPLIVKNLDAAEIVFLTCGLPPERVIRMRAELEHSKRPALRRASTTR